MSLNVRRASETDRDAWDRFVAEHPRSTVYHRFAWADVVRESMGHEPVFLLAESEGGIEGVLPAVLIAHPLFGRRLVSMPFVSYAGTLADDEPVRFALFQKAEEIAVERRVRALEVHDRDPLPGDVPAGTFKVLATIDMDPDPDVLWKNLRKQTRNSVRKSEKEGVAAERADGMLDDFYAVYSNNLRDLGTPVLSKNFFRSIEKHFPGDVVYYRARHEGKTIGVKMLFVHGQHRYFAWAATLREYNRLQPASLLQWAAIRDAATQGCTLVDLGRSTAESRHSKFKRYFGAELTPLYWHHGTRGGLRAPVLNTSNERFDKLIHLWQRLPLWAANAIGPWFARGLP